MDAIKNYFRFGDGLALALSVWVTECVSDALEAATRSDPNRALLFGILMLVALFLLQVMGLLFKFGFVNSSTIRKWILGKDYIEGVWFDRVRIGGKQFCGIITIRIEVDNIVVTGQQ